MRARDVFILCPFAVIVGCILVYAFLFKMNKINYNKEVHFWINQSPYSVDPLNYDSFIHHITFRSVLSPLLTQYKVGDYVGILAESWSSSPDFKTWSFKIRDGLTFENGDRITPELIVRSWTRMAALMKRRGSESGLLERIVGYREIDNPESEFKGLRIDGDTIIITFAEPFPKLLDTICFGLYSVVHPHDYNNITGEWIDPHKVISSGAYKVIEWSDDKLTIERRPEFLPNLMHSKPLQKIVFSWTDEFRNTADIVKGSAIDISLDGRYVFYGGATSRIAFLRCNSWKHDKSPFYDIKTRHMLRSVFYDELEKTGFRATLSYFPLAMNGVREMTYDRPDIIEFIADSQKLRYRPYNDKNLSFDEPYHHAMENASDKLGFIPIVSKSDVKQWFAENDSDLPSYTSDISGTITGILIEDPDADIRFMFLSKEGIRLPDTDGRIREELKKEVLDVQKINELLWDQAVIWPIAHFASGIWARSELDLSMLNTALPPTEFYWIGWK